MRNTKNPVEYLNNSVWSRIGVSKLHGVGVIAIRDIPKGTMITDFNLLDVLYGNKIPLLNIDIEKEFPLIRSEIRSLILDRMLVQDNRKFITCISPNHEQVLQSFMNHSNQPNSRNSIALKDIQAGEEITENYSDLVPVMHSLTKEHMNNII